MANRKKEIFRDLSIFSSGIYFAQIAYFLRGFLNAHILGPSMYGLWAALNIILGIGFYAHLGALQGMSREIPYALGRGDREKAEKARDNAAGFCLVSSIIVAACALGFSLVFHKSLGLADVIGLITIALLIVVQNMVSFYEMALSAIKRFSLISIANFLFPAIVVMLTFLLVPKWKIYGVYAIAVLGPLAMWLFYARYKIRFNFDIKEAARLIRIGFPLISLLLFITMLFVIDRVFILKFLGITELGYYALGLLICKFLFTFPDAVSKVIEPRLFHRYGETERAEDLKKYLLVPTKAMAVFIPLVIGVLYFVSSFIIRYFMKEYTPSLLPLFILLFGRFFLVFAPTAISFLTALNKQYKALYFYFIAIFLSAILDFLVLKAGFGLTGVSVATGVVSFALGTSLFIYAMSFHARGWVEHLGICLKVYFPYVYILYSTIMLTFIFKASGFFAADLLFLFLQIFILSIISVPLFLNLNRQIGFFEEARRFLKSRWFSGSEREACA